VSGSSSGSANLKYARGVGARVPPSQRPLRPLEWATLAHVAIFLVATTWLFGGQAEWVRTPLAWWGSLGILITFSAIRDRQEWRDGWMRPLWWCLPVLGFNALVLLACLNPSFREVHDGVDVLLVNEGGRAGWPSSARPALALHGLWVFDACWISCFNIALVLRQRRAVRALLLVAGVNALVLAIFGTAQKLVGASGIFFGSFPSPQKYFFASFVYHNHWGAFIVLMSAACIGLTWHYRRREARDFFHSPAFAGVIVVLLLITTTPLSASRSCTLLIIVLVGSAFLHAMARVIQKRRQFRESVALPVGAATLAVLIALTGIWSIARDNILRRLTDTRAQVSDMRAWGNIGSRGVLYNDTWHMARAKLWFGWGMGSYPHVFTLYNTRKSPDRLPVFYHDAHSDWLQALAEHGLVGSALLAVMVILPLTRLRRRHFSSSIPAYLLAGCGLILLYATVEFPFGNFAVILSWWFCFFCALHYGRLQDREPRTVGQEAHFG
jgi:hypothetical protein